MQSAKQVSTSSFRQPIVYQGRAGFYQVESTGPFVLDKKDQKKRLFQYDEEGVITSFTFHGTLKDTGLRIVLKDRTGAEFVLIDDTTKTLLKLGRGISPGDAETNPDGTSPDPTSIPHNVYPYVSRYKDTTETDETGDGGQEFVIAYEPLIPKPYAAIEAFVINRSGLTRDVRGISIERIVFVSEQQEKKSGGGYSGRALG